MKVCVVCKARLSTQHFSKNASRPDGLSHRCKECSATYQKTRKQAIVIKNSVSPPKRLSHKKCSSCHVTKESACFGIYTPSLDGLKSECKECIAQSDRFRKKSFDYRKSSSQASRVRYATDFQYRLKKCVRSLTSSAFKRESNAKSHKTLQLLGCTIVELQAHLVAQFRPGMTIENHGKVWHIDHIIPCARFDLSKPEHVKACFHYTNLQPLFVAENLTKQDGDDSIDWDLLIEERCNAA